MPNLIEPRPIGRKTGLRQISPNAFMSSFTNTAHKTQAITDQSANATIQIRLPPSKQQPTMAISFNLQTTTPSSMRRVSNESKPFIASPEDSRSWTRQSAAKREQDDVVVLGPYDIICGRCSTAFNNVGNRRFRATISLYLQRYKEAKSREDRGDAIMSVVRLLLDDIGARFLKKRGNTWVELGEKQAREKVGHALRDMSVQEQQEQQERRRCPITKNKLSSSANLATTGTTGMIQQHVEDNNSTTMLLLERTITPVDTPLDLTFLDSLDALLDFTYDVDELSLLDEELFAGR
jgi:hypothetical protein